MSKRIALPSAVIYDIDGTLCDNMEFVHWIDPHAPNYAPFEGAIDNFHTASIEAPPHYDILDMLNADRERGAYTVLLTARREKYREVTLKWLNRNKIGFEELVMRPVVDSRTDAEYKLETLTRLRQSHTVIRAVDDRPSVIQLWREHGIPDVHVAATWPDWHPEQL